MSDNDMKVQIAEILAELRNLANSLNHYTEVQEKHRQEIDKRLDKQDDNYEKRFDKIEVEQHQFRGELSAVKEKSATESAILKTIQDSNTANKRLAYGVIGSILVAAILGALSYKLGGGA